MVGTASAKLEQVGLSPMWKNFVRDRTPQSRNRLVERYMPFVRQLAVQTYNRMPYHVELDDLISCGVFGLIDAIHSYDPFRGYSFEAFSNKRIRGAMLDELRKTDWVPRLIRRRIRQFKKAVDSLQARKGLRLDSEQLTLELHSSDSRGGQYLPLAGATRWLSLQGPSSRCNTGEDFTMIESIKDKSGIDPVRLAQREDVRELIARSLNRHEQLVILLYYYERMTMKEVGGALGLCESRVSQIHSNVLVKLRQVLSERKDELQEPSC